MSDFTTTPNLGLFKPTYDADEDQWGFHWNQNADVLDAQVVTRGGGVAIVGTSPTSTVYEPLWWDSNSGQLFISYFDGSSRQWVSANSIDASTLEGSFLPITGGILSGGLTFSAPPANADYANLTGFLSLHGTTYGMQVSYGKPPEGGTLTQLNYVSGAWHNWVIGTEDYMTLDNRTLSVGTPEARAEPEWANGTWGGAARFVGGDNCPGLVGLTIKKSTIPAFPTGVTGWGIQRASAAGYAVWGVFGRADLHATGGATNEFNTFNYGGTPSGRQPPLYSFNSGEYNTFCLSCFPYGDYDSSFGLLIDKAERRFQTGIYIGQSSSSLWQLVLDANATDDLPANGALLIKHKGGVGVPLKVQITGGFVATNPVFTITDAATTTRFSVSQAGHIAASGIDFGSRIAGGHTDFTNHVALYGATYGMNVTNDGAMNYTSAAPHVFWSGTTRLCVMGAVFTVDAPLTAAGATLSNGLHFGGAVASSPDDVSRHIELYTGGYAGLSVTSGQLNYVVNGAGGRHSFRIAGAQIGEMDDVVGITSYLGFRTGGSSGPTWTTGSAVPSSVQPVGSLYSRVSTWAAGATLYVSKGAGAWTAVASV